MVFDSAPEYFANPRSVVELESNANGCLGRLVLNACLGEVEG